MELRRGKEGIMTDAIDIEKICPKCGNESEDYDGFGVIYCELCRYCQHVSITGNRCDLCRRTIKEKES